MLHRIPLLTVACVAAATAQSFDTTSITVPLLVDGVTVRTAHAVIFNGPGATQTYPSAVNRNGDITGAYDTSAGGYGFLRTRAGSFTSFSVPGLTDIYPDSINSSGAVAGNYDGTGEGFVRSAAGAWTTFNVPGTYPSSSGNPIAVNDAGVVVGPFYENNVARGFLRGANGDLAVFNAPDSTYTYPTDINNQEVITGLWNDSNYNSHGFIRDSSGAWTTFDVPGNNFGFFPPTLLINASGTVVGSYLAAATTYGFLWQAGSPLVSFTVSSAQLTLPSGINSAGAVAGSYELPGAAGYSGFFRSPAGTIYTFAIPNAIWTIVVGLDDADDIAGYYLDSSYASHGFFLEQSENADLRLPIERPRIPGRGPLK